MDIWMRRAVASESEKVRREAGLPVTALAYVSFTIIGRSPECVQITVNSELVPFALIGT
jgi:hypothetical protein